MRNKPPYALTSVDTALRLVQLLRDQGRLRVVDASAGRYVPMQLPNLVRALRLAAAGAEHGITELDVTSSA